MGSIPSTERSELKKTLTPWQVWALALGSIVGWGCFVLPGVRFLPEAGPMATIIAFALGGGILCFVALSYSHMIKHVPVAGGEFAYAYVGFGDTAAFICGWALVLGYLSIVAINSSALALLSRFLLPGVFEFGHLYNFAGWDVYLGEVLLMSGAIIFFGIMNYRGVSFAGSVQVGLAFALTAGIVALAVGSFTTETASIDNLRPFFSEKQSAFASIVSIVAIAPFLFVGFDTIPQAAEEFAFPPEKSRMLMIAAIGVGCVLYTLVTLAVGGIIPYPELIAQNHAWTTGTVATMAWGKLGGVILGTAVLGGVCTGMNGFYLATTRLILSMARGHFIPSWFGRVHPRYGTPHNAVLFTLGLCLLAPWFGRSVVGWVVDMSSVGTAIAYLFTCLTAYKMMKALPVYRNAAGSRIITVIGSIASFMCVALLLIPGSPAGIGTEPLLVMVAWIVMGIIFYMVKIPTVRATPEKELRYMLLGDASMPVFFKERERKQETVAGEA